MEGSPGELQVVQMRFVLAKYGHQPAASVHAPTWTYLDTLGLWEGRKLQWGLGLQAAGFSTRGSPTEPNGGKAGRCSHGI